MSAYCNGMMDEMFCKPVNEDYTCHIMASKSSVGTFT
jgi:hypothetical protein